MVSASYNLMAIHPFTSVPTETWRHLRVFQMFLVEKKLRKSAVKYN